MQPLMVVHIFNKVAYVPECIFKCLIFIEIYLLDLQCFYKTLSKSIVIRISFSRHADLDVMRLKTVYIILGRILNALIRMMNKTLKGIPWNGSSMPLPEHSWPDRFLCSCSAPTDALSAVEIQDNREKDMLVLQLDISDIRSPCLVQSRDFPAF